MGISGWGDLDQSPPIHLKELTELPQRPLDLRIHLVGGQVDEGAETSEIRLSNLIRSLVDTFDIGRF